MDYTKIYNLLISKAKERTLEGYSEKHHILPKCMDGDNSPENIVRLTAKEHYIAHHLLIKMYPENYKLVYAFWRMCSSLKKSSYVPSANSYQKAKELMSQVTKARLAENNIWKGKKHKESSKLKQSKSALVRKTTQANEQKRRDGISKNNQKPKSAEHTKHISEAKLGNKNPMFGKHWTLVNGKRIYT